ncbi:glycogen-binding domain-containing protein [uncultured Fibrobacter sp.]|uniref:glycogen-binding domain-containing protein n=1 Tax=uncultured Fibrobacter sp. TaxID=261512 RepID=UPI0025DC070E|nr:glycogen-binding domain-containing protein [uncultured Fibrobacter sp.]
MAKTTATKATTKKAAAKPAAAPKAAPKAAPAKKAAAAPKAAKAAATSAAPKKVTVEFIADCPLASTVSIAGTFNNWAVDVDMLKKDKKSGLWTTKIALVPGDYEYKFVCDGKNWDAGDNKIKHV